jgi:hypothetical protein
VTGCSQQVKIDDYFSEAILFDSIVPQGNQRCYIFVFIASINEVFIVLDYIDVLRYADDLKVFMVKECV